MFGIWRAALAVAVILYHLAGVPLIGEYAVGSFFVISGYLMTAIMAGSYGYTAQGRMRFFVNRALRLYPGYWISCTITLLLIAAVGPHYMASYHQGMQMPGTAMDWAQNLSMMFIDIKPVGQLPRLTPPSWALTVEWFYYVLIGLGLSRTPRLASLWLFASIFGVVALYIGNPYSPLLYASIPAGSLGFAAGAWTFHHGDAVRAKMLGVMGRMAWPLVLLGLCGAFLLPFVARRLLHIYADPVGNWGNIAFSVMLLVLLKDIRPKAMLERADKWLGDLSYPIYLLHWQSGAIASWLLFQEPVRGTSVHGIMVLALALPIGLLLSSLQIFLVDPAVSRYRNAIRAGEALREAPAAPAISV